MEKRQKSSNVWQGRSKWLNKIRQKFTKDKGGFIFLLWQNKFKLKKKHRGTNDKTRQKQDKNKTRQKDKPNK